MKPVQAPNTTLVDAGIRRLDFGPGPARAVGHRRRAGRPARVLPGRRPVAGRDPAALDEHRPAVVPRPPDLPDGRHVRRLARRARDLAGNAPLGLGRRRAGTPGPRRAIPAPARRDRGRPHVPRPVEPPRHAGPGRRLRGHRRPGGAAAHGRVGVEPRSCSPNGDGTLEAVRLALRATGATHWAARIASSAGPVRTDHRPRHLVRDHLARPHGCRRTRPGRSLHGDPPRLRRRRQQRATVVRDHGRHEASRGRAVRHAGPLLARRRTGPPTRPGSAGRRTRRSPASPGW